jgi:hypothetical protein
MSDMVSRTLTGKPTPQSQRKMDPQSPGEQNGMDLWCDYYTLSCYAYFEEQKIGNSGSKH